MDRVEDTIGFLMGRVIRVHRQFADDALKPLGLHVGQEIVLLKLCAEEGLTQSVLAQRLEVEPPTMTIMLNRMERAGLIERRPCLQDARVSLVYLTARGRSLELPVREVLRQLEERTLQGLSLTEQALLRRMLIEIRANFP